MKIMLMMMIMMHDSLSQMIYFPVGFATKPLPAPGTPLGSLTPVHTTMVDDHHGHHRHHDLGDGCHGLGHHNIYIWDTLWQPIPHYTIHSHLGHHVDDAPPNPPRS